MIKLSKRPKNPPPPPQKKKKKKTRDTDFYVNLWMFTDCRC